MTIACPQWRDCGLPDGGCCAIGKFEKPSHGTCNLVCKLDPTTPGPSKQNTALAWKDLHERPAKMVDAASELTWLTVDLPRRLSCGECATSWAAKLQSDPPDLSSPENYFAWTVGMHNAVNRLLDKPEMSVQAARSLYR